MSEDEYIEATDRAKLRIAYTILRDISGGCGPISEEWLKDILIRMQKMIKQVDARRLVE